MKTGKKNEEYLVICAILTNSDMLEHSYYRIDDEFDR